MTKTIDLADKNVTVAELVERMEADGDSFVVERNGKPVAELIGCKSKPPLTFDRLVNEVIPTLPDVDDDFLDDVRQIRREQGVVPESKWEF